MTTNKPKVVVYRYTASRSFGKRNRKWHYQESFPHASNREVAEIGQMEELIRLSDYEALQAECELLKAKIDAMAEYKVAAHQLIGIPASVGVCEPIEGFAARPQDIMPAVRDMALRIEELDRQSVEREAILSESQANDRQAMAYLNQIRAIVCGDDFPDMVRRCEKLRKDAERYRWLREQCCSRGGPLTIAKVGTFELTAWSGDDPDAAIDAAMETTK